MTSNFVPLWQNAEECPNCREKGMPPWQESSTARRCANCGHVEERNAVKARVE